MSEQDDRLVKEVAQLIAANRDEPPREVAAAVIEFLTHRMPPRRIYTLDRITEDYAQRFREAVQRDHRVMILPLETAEPERRYRELLAYIYLHVNWRYVSGKCTTEQRELWADACDAESEREHPGDGGHVPRWWRDDYVEER